VRDKPQTCLGCPAERVGRSFVPGRGDHDSALAFVGQGPGEVEAYRSMPFVGQSGQRLDKWCQRAGANRHDFYVTNIVQCWLPNNREPRPAEWEFCRQAHWGRELLSLPNVRVLVAVGVPAMKALIGGKVGERTAGSIFLRDLGEVSGRAADGDGEPGQGYVREDRQGGRAD
jgi:uracil-DNA glycosylase family 4